MQRSTCAERRKPQQACKGNLELKSKDITVKGAPKK